MRSYTRQADFLKYIKENPGVKTERIRLHFNISSTGIILPKMEKLGLVRSERDETFRKAKKWYAV